MTYVSILSRTFLPSVSSRELKRTITPESLFQIAGSFRSCFKNNHLLYRSGCKSGDLTTSSLFECDELRDQNRGRTFPVLLFHWSRFSPIRDYTDGHCSMGSSCYPGASKRKSFLVAFHQSRSRDKNENVKSRNCTLSRRIPSLTVDFHDLPFPIGYLSNSFASPVAAIALCADC
jgi:hypothetical protein